MVDITKCKNADCPIKESCYRWLAPDGEMQSANHFDYDVAFIGNVNGETHKIVDCYFYIKAVDTAK